MIRSLPRVLHESRYWTVYSNRRYLLPDLAVEVHSHGRHFDSRSLGTCSLSIEAGSLDRPWALPAAVSVIRLGWHAQQPGLFRHIPTNAPPDWRGCPHCISLLEDRLQPRPLVDRMDAYG